MNEAKITIGLTCYNAEDTIARAIKSALDQNWPNFEVLVVDDCSTDGSVAVVQSFEDMDGRIKLIRHEKNLGPGGARKTILERSTGDFLVFFDDDDISSPNRLTYQHKKIINYEEQTGASFVACYASGERIYSNGYVLNINAIGSRPKVPIGKAVAKYLLFYGKERELFYGAGTPTCALMARTNTFKKAGGFDPEFRRVEDVEFAVRLALMGGHFIGCKENLYTQFATEASDKSAEKNYEAEQKLLKKNQKFLEEEKRYTYACNWFRFRYYHLAGKPLSAFLALAKALAANPILVTFHLFETGPKRFFHEKKMRKG